MRSLLTNGWMRGGAIAGGLIVLGMLICPSPPAVSQADAGKLLASARAAQLSASYNAKGRCVWMDNGNQRTADIDFASRSGKVRTQVRAVFPDNATVTPVVEGKDTIAGRPARILRLKPVAKHVPWTQLWIDERTGVVLAFRTWSGTDKLTSSMKVLSISFADGR